MRYVDPRDIVLRDRDEFYVERSWLIMGMLVDLRHWPSMLNGGGFDESFSSWEPWKNLRETEMIHRYLILHGNTPNLWWGVVGVDRMWQLMK